MYVVSPWSRGGWVNSQVFDHSSVIRFLEARFGIHEPNISPWRRAVCGDLTSAFDFSAKDMRPFAPLPDPRAESVRAAAIPRQVKPSAPADQALPLQEPGIRRARALPYRLEARATVDADGVRLRFEAAPGTQAAVFHVYDAAALADPPRRFTVGPGETITGHWPFDPVGGYDLWVLGPNGFHRHFIGHRDDPATLAALDWTISPDAVELALPAGGLMLERRRAGRPALRLKLVGPRYRWSIDKDHGWYDATLTSPAAPGFLRRLSGRSDRPGRSTCSDPFV
jgi:phospholipase C